MEILVKSENVSQIGIIINHSDLHELEHVRQPPTFIVIVRRMNIIASHMLYYHNNLRIRCISCALEFRLFILLVLLHPSFIQTP